MNTEIGQDVTCAMVILLQGAICLIDEKALDHGIDNVEKQRWRELILRSSYWVEPFGGLHQAKVGLSDRLQALGRDELGPELERFLRWIEDLVAGKYVSQEDCRWIKTTIFAPTLNACERMSDGYLP
jgi:hypothetical protein